MKLFGKHARNLLSGPKLIVGSPMAGCSTFEFKTTVVYVKEGGPSTHPLLSKVLEGRQLICKFIYRRNLVVS